MSTKPESTRNMQRLTVPAGVMAATLVAILIPVIVPNGYWTHVATLAAIYWILISGLNLVVGYGGQLSVGHVGLLAVGSYTACALYSTLGWNPYVSLVAAAVVGMVAGLLIGLPSLRLRRFYFAMATIAFATAVSRLAVVWKSVTGGGLGIAAPTFGGVLSGRNGFYWFVLAIAGVATYLTWRIATSNSGRGLIAIRDAEVAAESIGVPVFRLKLFVFTISGALAGISGALYASLQTYVTPEAFSFDLSMLFFVAVLLGGAGRIAAPIVATIVLVLLPELAAPLAQWSAFMYAVLLLLVVLILPKGVGGLLTAVNDRIHHRSVPARRVGKLDETKTVCGFISASTERPLVVTGAQKSFGGVKALDGIDLDVSAGQIVGLIGPNGSGKTTVLNIISGFYAIDAGSVTLAGQDVSGMNVQKRAPHGIARCFQTPRTAGDLSALENVMLGGYLDARTSSAEALTGLGRLVRREDALRRRAMASLRVVGLEKAAGFRAELLPHSQLRFLEIARALVSRPRLLLLDEPASGLSSQEIESLGELIRAIASAGVGVLLVEHHADLVFDVCDAVTVLNFGRVLAAGSPEDVRKNDEVIHAYLGS